MPTDQEILEFSYHLRDLVNHSNETKELARVLFDLLDVEASFTLHQMSLDRQEKVKTSERYDPTSGRMVEEKEVEVVPLTERDYAKLNGIVEGMRWLENEVAFYIKKADREDKRKAEEEESKE